MVVNSSLQPWKPNGSMVDMLSLAKSSKVIQSTVRGFPRLKKNSILGMSVVHKIENTKTGPNDRPAADVVIADSGVIDVPDKLAVERQPVDAKI